MEEKKSTFNVLFYLKKNAPKKDGSVPVMIRTTIDGKIKTRSAKLSILPAQWDQNTMRAIGKSACAQQINNALDVWERNIGGKYDKILYHEGFVTTEKVDNAVMGVGVMENSLLKVFKKHNEDFEKMVGKTRASSTFEKYCDVYKHVETFMRIKYNRSDMALIELTEDFIRDFDLYLRVDRHLAPNTVYLYLMPVKKMTAVAKDKNIISIDPFKHYEVEPVQTDRDYLSMEEVQTMIMKKFFKPELELVRDIFIFSCFTGLSYSDIKNLTTAKLQNFFDGNPWIISRRQKTDVASNVPLLEIPKKLIEKYKGILPDNHIFPIPTNSMCNRHIKIIGAFCGITKDINFHMARHTFGTLMLTQGVPIESVSRMMGHTNITTTQIYAKITNDKVSKDMAILSSKLQTFESALVAEL